MYAAERPQQVDARDYDDLRALATTDYGLTPEDIRALEYIWRVAGYPWEHRRNWQHLRTSDTDDSSLSPLLGMSVSAFRARVTTLAELGFFDKMDPKDGANHRNCNHSEREYRCQVHVRNMRLPILPLPEPAPKPEPAPAGPRVEPGVLCPKCGGPCRASAYKCTRFSCGHEFTASERAQAERKAARHLQVVPSPEPVASDNTHPGPSSSFQLAPVDNLAQSPGRSPAIGPAPALPPLAPEPSKPPKADHIGADGTPCPPVVWAPHPTARGVLRGQAGAMGFSHAPPASTRGQGRDEGAPRSGAEGSLEPCATMGGRGKQAPLPRGSTRIAPPSTNAEGP